MAALKAGLQHAQYITDQTIYAAAAVLAAGAMRNMFIL